MPLTTSRRDFLKLMGVSVAGAHLASLNGFTTTPANLPQITRGRVLYPLVLHTPHGDKTRLFPDTLVDIQAETADGMYHVTGGFVEKVGVQPLFSVSTQLDYPASPTPHWSEVTDPVALVYQWCATDSPIVSRIGQGGVLRVVDTLPGHRLGQWLKVARHDGTVLGWTLADGWSPVDYEMIMPSDNAVRVLNIDPSQQMLVATENENVVLEAPASVPMTLAPGRYSPQMQVAGGSVEDGNDGAAWLTDFDEARLMGVYWHNRFGMSGEGSSVHVSPLVARWLYRWLDEHAAISVV